MFFFFPEATNANDTSPLNCTLSFPQVLLLIFTACVLLGEAVFMGFVWMKFRPCYQVSCVFRKPRHFGRTSHSLLFRVLSSLVFTPPRLSLLRYHSFFRLVFVGEFVVPCHGPLCVVFSFARWCFVSVPLVFVVLKYCPPFCLVICLNLFVLPLSQWLTFLLVISIVISIHC